MTKLSFKTADFASTVVPIKGGRYMEVRRGPLTGKAIPNRRTWGSEAAWRATLPPPDATTRLYELLESYKDAESDAVRHERLGALMDFGMTPEGRGALDTHPDVKKYVQFYAHCINNERAATIALRRKAHVFLRAVGFRYTEVRAGLCCAACSQCERNNKYIRPLTQEEEDAIVARVKQVAGDTHVEPILLTTFTEVNVIPSDLPHMTEEQTPLVRRLKEVLNEFNEFPHFLTIFTFPPPAPVLEVEELPVAQPKLSLAPVSDELFTVLEEYVSTLYQQVSSLRTMRGHLWTLIDLLIAAPPHVRTIVRKNYKLLAKIRTILYNFDWPGYPEAEKETEKILSEYSFLF